MNELCRHCWNDGCKANEELRLSKVEVCRHMEEHPEEWEGLDDFVEEDEW